MTTEPMTVGVVGATGFVGGHVVPHLDAAGHRVIAVSRKGNRRSGWGSASRPARPMLSPALGSTPRWPEPMRS